MHKREQDVSTAMGNGLAIPHGLHQARGGVNRTAIAILRLDEPVDWNGQPVDTVIGIAATGDQHLAVLGRIAEIFSDEEKAAAFKAATSYEAIQHILSEQS